MNPIESGWEGVIGASIGRQNHDRDDLFAEVTSAVSGTTASANIDIGKQLTRKLEFAAGYAIVGYTGSAIINSQNPNANLYLTLFRPELDLEAEGSRSQSGRAAILWKVGKSSRVFLAAQVDQLQGVGASTAIPKGAVRRRSGISLGFSVAAND